VAVVNYGRTDTMIRSLTAVGAALAAMLALAVSAAPAAAATWNQTWAYMNDYDPGACAARTLTLNGTYRWQVFGYHWAHHGKPARTRTVRLRGRYAWRDCIFRHPATGRVHYYEHESLFRNVRTGGKVYLYHPFTAYGDGRYRFGSTIQNVRARR
jgi:hypothetical protein